LSDRPAARATVAIVVPSNPLAANSSAAASIEARRSISRRAPAISWLRAIRAVSVWRMLIL
jgi:hypothetical protein